MTNPPEKKIVGKPPTATPEWHQLSIDQQKLYKKMNRAYKEMFLVSSGKLLDDDSKDLLKEIFFRASCDFALSLNEDLQNLVLSGSSSGYNPDVHN